MTPVTLMTLIFKDILQIASIVLADCKISVFFPVTSVISVIKP